MKHIKISPGWDHDLWFTSDTHFDHKNIVSGTSGWEDKSLCRKHDTLEDHNVEIINRINHCVKHDDLLIHLGDWSFRGVENVKKFRDQLFCRNIHLVLGNHDQHIESNKDNVQDLFLSVSDKLHIKYKNLDIICNHFPEESWWKKEKGSIHLFGHQHSSRIGPGKKMDIGIDKEGVLTYPYNILEIVRKLKDF